ncbi:MAG: ATP-binding protein [Chitinophagales bacterium]|nr:ATP-binding protein [Chitinophagales bacterium]
MRKGIVKDIIVDNQEEDYSHIYARDIILPIKTNKIISLTGVRRCGKTHVLFHTIKKLLEEGVEKQNILHINFEDERIDWETADLDLILQAYTELHPNINLKECYFFFDEIQNVKDWQKFIRRVDDSVSKNIFITGSNSSMLSSDIATSLRGRNINYEIFPLSFSEYLRFNKMSTNYVGTKQKSEINRLFQKYLKEGGFPELINLSDDVKQKTLQEYFYVMLYKDIIERYEVSNPTTLKYFLNRVLVNVGKPTSVHKIYNELKSGGYKVSKNTLYDFLEYSEAVYLNFALQKFDYSLIKRESADKKNYFIDNGLMNALTFKFSKDYGMLLENLVYLHLRRMYKNELFYYKNGKECDFVIFEKEKVKHLIQVCYNTEDTDTLNREVKSLIYTAKKLDKKEGIIITLNDTERIIEEGQFKITIMPIIKFLLTNILD